MNNPYIGKISGILTDIQGWMYALIGMITIVVIIKHGIEYQQGDAMEKSEAKKNIKRTLYMGGGIFFLAWFATYVVQKMQS